MRLKTPIYIHELVVATPTLILCAVIYARYNHWIELNWLWILSPVWVTLIIAAVLYVLHRIIKYNNKKQNKDL